MTIAHTFAIRTKAFPEAIRRYLDPLPGRAAPAPPSNGPPETAATHDPPRLRLKPKDRHQDYIDGAWWPRSTELAAELPDLLAVLTVRLGPVDRIVYDLYGWSQPPRHMTVGGRWIGLESYPFHLRNTMYVIGADTAVTVLRVIPPSTDGHTAHSELVSAAIPREE